MNHPHEFKVLRVRECQPEPAMIDTPERAVEYWRANIPTADWFDPAKEAFVVLVLACIQTGSSWPSTVGPGTRRQFERMWAPPGNGLICWKK